MSVDDFCAKVQRLANDVGADELMLRFAVINGLNPEIRNHVTRAQPNNWTNLVQQAKVGEMCVPVLQPSDDTLAVKLEVIQDQLKQLTDEKAKPRSVSPVCSAGRSDRRDSMCSNSRPGSPRRVRFDPSADRGMQDYRKCNNNEQNQNGNTGDLQIPDLGEAVVHVVPVAAVCSSARAHQTIASQIMRHQIPSQPMARKTM